ncbi:MAG: hypothetical protein JXM74_09260, partial [Fusobacteriaceae bacterium]|nr:hypothetical protein [Fusobacteriaceae bacterium]
MHISTLMLVATLFYLFLILISYFRKERIRLLENKIYESLLITTIIGVVIDFFGIYAHLNFTEESFLRWFIVKIYLLFLLTFVFLLTLYIIFSSAKNKNNSWRNDGKIVGWYRITAIIYSLSFIINLILPFEYFKDGNSVYVSGPNTIFVFAMTGVAMLGWLLFIALNYTQINKEKYFPIILFVIIGAPLSYIQMIFPDLLLVTGVAGFIVVLMYHTIENPDVKLL